VAREVIIGSVPGANGVLTVTLGSVTPGTLTDTTANIGNAAGSFAVNVLAGITIFTANNTYQAR
jgi:hypothetical protein